MVLDHPRVTHWSSPQALLEQLLEVVSVASAANATAIAKEVPFGGRYIKSLRRMMWL